MACQNVLAHDVKRNSEERVTTMASLFLSYLCPYLFSLSQEHSPHRPFSEGGQEIRHLFLFMGLQLLPQQWTMLGKLAGDSLSPFICSPRLYLLITLFFKGKTTLEHGFFQKSVWQLSSKPEGRLRSGFFFFLIQVLS